MRVRFPSTALMEYTVNAGTYDTTYGPIRFATVWNHNRKELHGWVTEGPGILGQRRVMAMRAGDNPREFPTWDAAGQWVMEQ